MKNIVIFVALFFIASTSLELLAQDVQPVRVVNQQSTRDEVRKLRSDLQDVSASMAVLSGDIRSSIADVSSETARVHKNIAIEGQQLRQTLENTSWSALEVLGMGVIFIGLLLLGLYGLLSHIRNEDQPTQHSNSRVAAEGSDYFDVLHNGILHDGDEIKESHIGDYAEKGSNIIKNNHAPVIIVNSPKPEDILHEIYFLIASDNPASPAGTKKENTEL